jgi:hypothetical protein
VIVWINDQLGVKLKIADSGTPLKKVQVGMKTVKDVPR